ncbi:helix-turn-helix domain-containing protein [Enterocloster lavalensis]|uniref:helix-turn-helix domain-containing protein n=1 Tax=Enterocloster lavalensis TaxID=460384 RepID=UPI001D0856B3|nr:helix-turn-helix domain-containing protein [Enterocloster lavalensis]MCB6342556.1 helix-turn-helix domain-containing protein [Enterocloster lavalensis]
MTLSYSDINLLRYIQKRQRIALSSVANQFHKNETSIRRSVRLINLFAGDQLIMIQKGVCISQISYKQSVDFIQKINGSDYISSVTERFHVMIVMIFFHGYVNASTLYETWGLSTATKKKDTIQLRRFLKDYNLQLDVLKKKGLTITGDELQFRFLVIDILHPLFEFTFDNEMVARFANTPLENYSYRLTTQYLLPAFPNAVQQLNLIFEKQSMILNYPSRKFMLLYICFMDIRPCSNEAAFTYRLPLAPLNLHFSDHPLENKLYNVVASMMNFSRSIEFPHDKTLWHITEQFLEQVVNHLNNPFIIQESFINEIYNYFYREIIINHFRCTFVDKTTEDTREQFKELYELIEKYESYYKAAYQFSFKDEQISTLTLLVQKHILRNRIVVKKRKKIIVMTNISFERISYFLEQLQEYVSIQWVATLNINDIHKLKELKYDYILTFSARNLNILKSHNLPVIRINFFVTEKDIERLHNYGFRSLNHRFLLTNFISEISGKTDTEIGKQLSESYNEFFV